MSLGWRRRSTAEVRVGTATAEIYELELVYVQRRREKKIARVMGL